jgi:hypothetical protein
MATFGSIASANPNVLFDPARAMGAAQQYKQNELLMQHRQQDQQAQTFERDATARISLARQMADLPDDVLATEWGPAVQRLQAAGLGQGIDPSKPPPRERLRQIAASDLTTFQRLQIDEQRRQTEALGGLATGGGAPAQASVPSVPGAAPGAAPAAPAGGGGQAPAGAPVRPFVAQNLPEGVDVETDQLVRTVLGEAGGEDDRGQMAVVGVIGNRAKQSGMDTTGVIFAPKQFEPWNNPQVRARLEAIDPASPAYQRALANVRKVRSGLEPDPTGGATHFYSPTAQAGLGRPPPSWDNGKGVDLGRHRFFSLGYGPGSGAPGAPPGQQQAGVPAPQPTPPGGVAARTPGATDMAGPGVPRQGYEDPRTLGLPEQDSPALFALPPAAAAAPPQQVAAAPPAQPAPAVSPQNPLAPAPQQAPASAGPAPDQLLAQAADLRNRAARAAALPSTQAAATSRALLAQAEAIERRLSVGADDARADRALAAAEARRVDEQKRQEGKDTTTQTAAQQQRLATITQQEGPHLERLASASGIIANGERLLGLIESGKIEFGGVVTQGVARARNATGYSNESSRNFADLERHVTESVNAVLAQAAGPQTDQDATRARDQILSNLNDKEAVKRGLRSLNGAMERARQIATARIQGRRRELSLPEADLAPYTNLPPNVTEDGGGGGKPTPAGGRPPLSSYER